MGSSFSFEGTKQILRVVKAKFSNILQISRFERVTVRKIRVSIPTDDGRSVRSAGGRKTEEIEEERDARTVNGEDYVEAVTVNKSFSEIDKWDDAFDSSIDAKIQEVTIFSFFFLLFVIIISLFIVICEV